LLCVSGRKNYLRFCPIYECRLAVVMLQLGVESFIYFANARPAYRWSCFGGGNTKKSQAAGTNGSAPSNNANNPSSSNEGNSSMCLAYAFTKPDRLEQCVVFWNLKTDERHLKYVKRLISIHGSIDSEYCVLVTGTDPSEADLQAQGGDPLSTPAASGPYGTPLSSQYILILCNSIGSPIDSKYINVRPDHVTVTGTHVCVASTDTLYCWQFSAATSSVAGEGGAEASADDSSSFVGVERVFHVDETNNSKSTSAPAASTVTPMATTGPSSSSTRDPICCITASHKHLLVARDSGAVLQFSLPNVIFENKFQLRCRPAQLSLNCDSTRFSIIDINYTLSLFDMEASTAASGDDDNNLHHPSAGSSLSPSVGVHLPFEKKDVWQMVWASDYPDLWACMEKARMYIFRGTDPEEPTLSSGYLCRFDDLTITSVLLDDVMAQPDKPDRGQMVVAHETRSLRDSRMLLARTGLKDSAQFIQDNAHPRLWRLLAETALEKLDLNTAERAYVACQDYPGIQFVKRLRLLHDKAKQRAEVLVYFKRSDEAERLYIEMDRRDLAIDMRMRMGQWAHVLRLLTSASSQDSLSSARAAGVDDATLALARTRLGDMLVDRQQWSKAIPFYEAAKAYDALVECYYITEDYTSLQGLIAQLPEGAGSSRLLLNIANKLQSVGLTDGAASAYLKAGDVKGAVDCSVMLNQWDRAIELAEKHKLPQIEGLLSKYAASLIEGGKTISAIELYRRANRDGESAKLLAKLATDVANSTSSKQLHPLRVKKLYVLAALEMENHRKRVMDALHRQQGGSASAAGVSAPGANARQSAAAATEAAMSNLLKADTADILSSAGAGGAVAPSGLGELSAAAAAAARSGESAWHGAEAYHFFMLAQRQLYSGDILSAMITSQRLSLYEDMLNPQDTYSLIALTAYYSGRFGACSKAFMKLEALEAIPIADREAYGDLALAIFSKTRPVDPEDEDGPQSSSPLVVRCPSYGCGNPLRSWSTNCMRCGAIFPACVATGKPLFGASGSTEVSGSGDVWRCGTCKHRAIASVMKGKASCPLCHAAVAGSEGASLGKTSA
jgi:WD repeat-containing protein 35